jgi:hypothetical protein
LGEVVNWTCRIKPPTLRAGVGSLRRVSHQDNMNNRRAQSGGAL